MMLIKPIVPVFQYVLDFQYISQVLCVNKENPELQCNGKCHLMKELAKASESEKATSSDKKNNPSSLEILFVEPFVFFQMANFSPFLKLQNASVYHNLYTLLNCDSIFHPPSLFF